MNRWPIYLCVLAFFMILSAFSDMFIDVSVIRESGWSGLLLQAAPRILLALGLLVAAWRISKKNKIAAKSDPIEAPKKSPAAAKAKEPREFTPKRIFIGLGLFTVGALLAVLPTLMSTSPADHSASGFLERLATGILATWLLAITVPLGGGIAIFGLYKIYEGLALSKKSVQESTNNKKFIWPAIAMFAGIAIFKSPDYLAVIFKWVENGNSNFIVYLSLVTWPGGVVIFIYGLAKLIQAIRK